MLQSFDVISFKCLIFIYSFLGIKDVPQDQVGGWVIEERWVEQDDESYRLVMTNKDIGRSCLEAGSGYVVFPQTYMGQLNVYADGKKIFTNSMSSKWQTTELMSKPLFNCDIFKNTNEVTLEIFSYIKFFTSVSSFPILVKSFPFTHIFYVEMFFVSAVVSLFLGLLGTVLILKFTSFSEALLYLFQQCSFAVFVATHISGIFLEINIKTVHTLIVVSGFFALASVLLNTVDYRFSKIKLLTIIGVFTLVPSYLFHGYKNATHMLILLLITMSLFISVILFFYKLLHLKKNKDYTVTFVYFILAAVISYNGISSQMSRTSFFHLSSIVFIASSIAFLRVLQGVNAQQLELVRASIRLDSELKTISSVKILYNSYKEIVHDVKSPLMSLMFLTSDSIKNKNTILQVSVRLKNILGRFDELEESSLVAWYSVHTTFAKISDLFDEKKRIFEKLTLRKNYAVFPGEIYYNPIDFEIIVAELIDNAIKYSTGEIDLEIYSKDNNIIYSFTTVNISSEESLNIKDHGLRKIGFGIGLQNIKKKISGIGASVEVVSSGQVFSVKLVFSCRAVNV